MYYVMNICVHLYTGKNTPEMSTFAYMRTELLHNSVCIFNQQTISAGSVYKVKKAGAAQPILFTSNRLLGG